MIFKKYNPQKIEPKWQKFWKKQKIFQASNESKKKKYYILVEFPYPSGEGLHVGHCRSYVALDILARQKRMQRLNVLFPMGWDAFGLPTENFAVKTGIHPSIVTRKNSVNFKKQQEKLGLSFDWSREINTTDPSYYKWTQFIFLQLFKKGLAYKSKIAINWCPSCKIGLANEEVISGCCERCGAQVVRKEKEQWMLKITKYAERLIKDLDKVDYPERVKVSQKEWIGKSQGVEIKFSILNLDLTLSVFTTRPDTLFGCTYLVLAPEHPLIEKIGKQIKNYKNVQDYIKKAKERTEKDRLSLNKEKQGIELRGVKAINPVNNKEVPIFIADYVLIHYGTGAIMAVPAHDQRDFDFAQKQNLPILEVIKPYQGEDEFRREVSKTIPKNNFKKVYAGEGSLINSGNFSGLDSKNARQRIQDWLEKKGLAQKSVNYKLRDWVFSRQRYWGEPIPMIKCARCGWVPVPEKDLPVKLPKVREYKPADSGESPLSKIQNWVKVKCPRCGGDAQRETDVMPNWAGSNWYYIRFCDPNNDKNLASQKLLKQWMPVDWYNGGMEHTTLHLLYSRFIYKFLWDIGLVPKSIGPEPYKKRTSHGIILGQGGIKMSKSKGNVINPNEVLESYGADAMRIYEMFMGPFEQMIPWDTKGIKGIERFLNKIWKICSEFFIKKENKKKSSVKLEKLLHRTIKKVSENIENLKLNTAISSLMEFSNIWQEDISALSEKDFKSFLKILTPFAPHIAEEIWNKSGYKGSIHKQKWPEYSLELTKERNSILAVQINGKVRATIEIEEGVSKEEVEKSVLSQEKIIRFIGKREIKKTIFVPGKIINFVI
jgi:leucyl-tRNA synthetase